MKKYLLFTLLSFFVLVSYAQSSKKKVAVYVTGEIENSYKKVVGSKMVSCITKSDMFTAVERTSDFLVALSEEQSYQLSGVVKESQIVKIGQQFGVRYVAVVDVSEVFESMFISARMIDVQTGEISGSAESSGEVKDLNALTTLSETVASELVGGIVLEDFRTTYNVDDVKVLGPFDNDVALQKASRFQIPEGYHVANRDELKALINSYKVSKKHIYSPIYLDFEHDAPYTSQYSDSYRSNCYLYIKDKNEYKEIRFGARIRKDGRTEDNIGDGLGLIPGYIYLIKNK